MSPLEFPVELRGSAVRPRLTCREFLQLLLRGVEVPRSRVSVRGAPEAWAFPGGVVVWVFPDLEEDGPC